MDIRYLMICYLLYLANAKLVSKAIEENNAAVETVTGTATSKQIFDTETIRKPRHTNEPAARPNPTRLDRAKSEVVLVKKPIPKFTDAGSEEDYQAAMRFSNKISDSIEHEDEDFSVDDYDFDVNHDEFAGRGKPLEPRVRVKVRQRRPTPAKVEPPQPAPTLSQTKVKIPHSESKPSLKVARNAATGVMKEEEYDEEFSAITKSPRNQRQSIPVQDRSTSSEETEESREQEIMKRPMRAARSSSPFSFGSYVNKLEENTPDFVTKMLSYLPLFPQRYISPEKVNDDAIVENATSMDP